MIKYWQLIVIIAISMVAPSSAHAQETVAATGGSTELKQAELERLLAPIALYPDSLIAQILMASTYPLEIVQADRWVKTNGNLAGDALTTALEKEDWDPSVKSLVNFPQVLSMMSEELEWTTSLGDAFLAQQKDVMAAVQALRTRAKQEGNLESNQQQTVIVKEEANTQVIVVESASPEVVYVPTYNPTVVYGTWPYPAYPPHYYYPPGYVATAAVSFGLGVACGAAWGYAWGGCNWGHGDVDIDIDRNSFVNNRIDRDRYRTEIGNRNRNMQNGRGSWRHDPSHRRGTSYRDQGTAQRFGGKSSVDAARSRDAFRGRAEAGRQDLARGSADQFRQSRPSTRTTGSQVNRGSPGSGQRPETRAGSQQANRSMTGDRTRGAGRQATAFDGAGQGSRARSDSQRGRSSRQSSYSPSRSSGRSSGSFGGSRGSFRGGGRGGGRR